MMCLCLSFLNQRGMKRDSITLGQLMIYATILSVVERSGKINQGLFSIPLILLGNIMMQFSNVPECPNTNSNSTIAQK